jgi:hypothetical protein
MQGVNRKRKEEAMEEAKRARLQETSAAALGAELQQAMNAKPSRAGERKRQAENKRLREEAAMAEEAAKRRRAIADTSTASTAAQKIMARIKQKVAAREGTQLQPHTSEGL